MRYGFHDCDLYGFFHVQTAAQAGELRRYCRGSGGFSGCNSRPLVSAYRLYRCRFSWDHAPLDVVVFGVWLECNGYARGFVSGGGNLRFVGGDVC